MHHDSDKPMQLQAHAYTQGRVTPPFQMMEKESESNDTKTKINNTNAGGHQPADDLGLGLVYSEDSEVTSFDNQLPEELSTELEYAKSIGVTPMSSSDERFDELINSGTLIWTINTNGELSFALNTVNHTVLTGGASVISAGEADIAPDGNGGYSLLDITNQSGHYQPDESSLAVAREIFNSNGIK